MNTKTVRAIAFLLLIIAFLVYTNITTKKSWEDSEKLYAIAFVKGKVSGSGPSREKYIYTIESKKYDDCKYNLIQDKYYIVTILKDDFSKNSIEVEIPVDPTKLLPQPLNGWKECPINEDGTIKEKFRIKN